METGYLKKGIFKGSRSDAWLLKYPTGSKIPLHTDPVAEGNTHYRLNIVIKKPAMGGVFSCKKTIFNFRDVIVLFRPDKEPHRVSEIVDGSRWVVSFGWLVGE